MDAHINLPLPPSTGNRPSRFQLKLVSQSTAMETYGDDCKETCKIPIPPNTCKLECHSGAPFTDLDEEAPKPVVC